MTDRPAFATLLRELRRAAGLTQDELAVRAGVGVRTLRDLEAGRAVRPQRSTVDLLADGLGLHAADRARFSAAARGRPPASVQLPPVPVLVGRTDDVAAAAALLDVADLVTLVGLAGAGRAAVALTVARRVADQFPGGVGLVSVGPASTESDVLTAALDALGLADPDELVIRLTAETALLVATGVDESDAAIAALSWLRSRAPRLRLLATSRRPLGLSGEHEWAVAPLAVPEADAEPAEIFASPAVAFFLDRLARVRRRPVDSTDAATLGALARRLGGLPRALDLAAARGRVLELDEILGRIGPDEPVGQAVYESVRSTWWLLTPPEQACVGWLSVFERRWSIDLAEELLAGGPGRQIPDVVDLVDRLVRLGLVQLRPEEPAPTRFCMLDVVRSVVRREATGTALLTDGQERYAAMMARLAARTPQA